MRAEVRTMHAVHAHFFHIISAQASPRHAPNHLAWQKKADTQKTNE